PIEITGDITEKQVAPWAAKIGTGGSEFGNFTPCDIREYADLRGGLGLEAEEQPTQRFYWAEGVETTKDRYWTLGPLVSTMGALAATPLKIIDYKSTTYAFANGVSKYLVTGTSTWTATGDASPLATPTDVITFKDATGNYLVVCNGADARYCLTGYGGSQDWASLTTNDIKYMAALDNRLWGIDSTGTTLYYSAVGNVDGTWGSFALSGDYATVTDLFEGKLLTSGDPCLYMLTAEGLFAIDVYAQKAYKQEVRYPLTTQAKCGMYWNGAVYISTGMGIAKITGNDVTQFGPDEDDGLNTDYQGYITDMIGSSHWVIVAVAGGTKDSILKRHETMGGWHQVYTSSTAVETLCYSPASLYAPGRLWFGDATNVKWVQFPDYTHDVTKVATYTYAATGDLILPRFSTLSIIPKIAIKCEALSQDLTGTGDNENVTVYYRTDNNAGWTSLGEFTTSPHPTLPFGSSLGTSFNDIQFKLTFARTAATTTDTPKIRAFAFKYLTLPSTVSMWQFTVKALGSNAKRTITSLETVRDGSTLVNFSPDGDLNISTKYIRLVSMPSRKWLDKYADEKEFVLSVSEVE
ncbi:MAG: hypothetical protein MUP19_07755, partial [Candidatus Aminicenantes bacterium]|nr:hypothetical protein [Candidatus Aminicenantes bacterium]